MTDAVVLAWFIFSHAAMVLIPLVGLVTIAACFVGGRYDREIEADYRKRAA